jgi:cbb3-type cytochrome oxidase cytochrome c subunit
MVGYLDDMKVKEIAEDIGERELIIKPMTKSVDRYGRIFVGIDYAEKEVFLLGVKPTPQDKKKWGKRAGWV